MICTHTQTTCPTPNACRSHRLVICPLSATLAPCEEIIDKCEMHDLCPAASGDPVMVAQLVGEERRIVEMQQRLDPRGGQHSSSAEPFRGLLGSAITPWQTLREQAMGLSGLNCGKLDGTADVVHSDSFAEFSRDAAIRDLLLANHKIGRWLSAALDDPTACAEFKADIEAWMDEDATVRRLFGLGRSRLCM